MIENHIKYARNVMPDIEESLSKITAMIPLQSVVLDIGCSSGMLGRFLVHEKSCVIDGIDIDESALRNCKPAYRKVIIKNLETDDFLHNLIAESYDYIIVADVIEHLIQPENLLKQLRLLVKPHGTIIFSVPNITHIAASLELLSGRFNYAQNGLLDNTHLRFYSYQSLIEKLERSGLYLSALDTVRRELSETEFGETQVSLFPRQWLEAVIESRPDALVYQWLVSTKLYPVLIPVNDVARHKKLSTCPVFTTALYWEADAGSGFNELNKLPGYKKPISNKQFEVEFRFPLSDAGSVHQLRIDPASEMKSIWVKNARLLDAGKNIVWQWDASEAQSCLVNAHWSEIKLPEGKILFSENDDPQWYPQIPPSILETIKTGSQFVMTMSDHQATLDAQLEAAWNKHNLEIQNEILRSKGENQLLSLNIAEHERNINTLQLAIQNKDSVITELHHTVGDRDTSIHALNQVLTENDASAMVLRQALDERDSNIHALNQAIEEREAYITRLVSSHSWVITKPFRYIRRNLNFEPLNSLSRVTLDGVRFAWSVFPLPRRMKGRLKGALLTQFPSLFTSYRNWASKHTLDAHLKSYLNSISDMEVFQTDSTTSLFVPLLQSDPLESKPVKIICFYLPQYHAIAENDAWWGEGFTEWTNVKPAQPQFINHYQPHIPGELGYYNLLDSTTQRRQIELAKLYGIEGFCFYFYWFGGKRLLETPIENYANDSSLDLPFCLCWANENWSRRWDGLDHEMLIAQQHSPEDDLAFIEHIAKYMRDPRYIRIDGKPLLIVYRPGLLPDPNATVARWRNWCREHGIGEIYLSYTQSFEAVDPATYDFDAAIEFPPNNSALPNITNQVKPLRSDFEANVYDYRVFIERSENYEVPKYKLFRSACPSWDNTARRKNKGSILLNSSPFLYQKWLANAIQYTENTQEIKDERLIFVNAWNEWAEGAHLEPDQRYGCAYLEATRMAQVKANLRGCKKTIDRQLPIAIVIHAFYEEVFDEILDYLKKFQNIPCILYVTAPAQNINSLSIKLTQSGKKFVLLQVENRGRDVLPFLKIMPQVVQGNHEIVLKIHTKKSLHRDDGDVWRRDLFQDLISEESVENALNYFELNPQAGILGPLNHIVPMSFYWGANAKSVYSLANRLGVDTETVDSLSFIAGTMFCARVAALIPLLNLSINDDDFEREVGQIDGTLAHAVERAISVSVVAAGFSMPTAEVKEYQFVT
jgi:lipopolysaccharide biosynthesis protein/2-polyprenyl-3-methyl-5-hydroxy-6-metoxy-1,4-benzoquinol methylase